MLHTRCWAKGAAPLVSIALPGLSVAATLHVPGDFPTIQACIDAAVSGVDECVVAPGTYHETINLLGKAIILRSSGGRDVTTIDATGIGGSVVTCANGEGPDTVLDGFTITGGTGTPCFTKTRSCGGGMYNSYAHPTVSNCIFNDNTSTYGGGMFNNYSHPTVTNCTLSENTAFAGSGMINGFASPLLTNCMFTENNGTYGAGMSNQVSNPTVINCTFSGNTVSQSGGAIENVQSSPFVSNCTFSGNTATFDGGGIKNRSSDPTFTNCTFLGNTAQNGGGMNNDESYAKVTNCAFVANTGYFGGGIYTYRGTVAVANCAFTRNTAQVGGGMYNRYGKPTITNSTFNANSVGSAGGMYNVESNPTVANCAFSANKATVYGGGMYNDMSSSPSVANCTFSGNTAAISGGGIVNHYSSSPTVTNCVFWGDSPNEIAIRVAPFPSAPTIHFSDVQGGLPVGAIDGGGNIDLDPMFIRPPDPGPDGTWDGVDDDYGDLRLQAGSPCIDAGDPKFVPQPGETDPEGHARVLCEYVDMGAYEFGIGDYDCDQTVNLTDFAGWNVCMTGPLDSDASYSTIDIRHSTFGCEAFDFNGDGFVDLSDFAAFQLVLTAP